MSLASERSTVLLAKQPYAFTAQKRTQCRIISSSACSMQTNVYPACARSWPRSAQHKHALFLAAVPLITNIEGSTKDFVNVVRTLRSIE